MAQLSLRSRSIRKNNSALLSSVDRLGEALAADSAGQEREWALESLKALAQVNSALSQHMAITRGADGLFPEGETTRPSLNRQADELVVNLNDLLGQGLALENEWRTCVNTFEPATALSVEPGFRSTPDLEALRQQTERFLTGLRQNLEAATLLVFEDVNTDIGVGD